MTMLEVNCTAVAIQNSSEWPCSMCPIPQAQTCGGEDIMCVCVCVCVFLGHLEFWTPLQIPTWGPPLGCTLLQSAMIIRTQL